MNINKVVLGGNLTANPEIRYTTKGTGICNFTIANNRVWYEGSDKREEVNFLQCVAFGKMGENIGKYFQKGKPILIEARLKLETWDDKQTGQKRSSVKLIVEAFHFAGDIKKQDDGARQQRSEDAQPDAPEDDSEVPF